MADKAYYPQIPSTVWWGVRGILQRTPNVTVDERYLAVHLNVQEAAARAYVRELKTVGLLTEDGKATDIARRWRMDETYGQAVAEIISAVYPEQLVHLAPPGGAERQKVISWFQHEGLGQGAAGNKAATYLLLSSPSPADNAKAVSRGDQGDSSPRAISPSRKTVTARVPQSSGKRPTARSDAGDLSERPTEPKADFMPLNVNVQIHISADAGTDQIDSIFQAMRRYLYDALPA